MNFPPAHAPPPSPLHHTQSKLDIHLEKRERDLDRNAVPILLPLVRLDLFTLPPLRRQLLRLLSRRERRRDGPPLLARLPEFTGPLGLASLEEREGLDGEGDGSGDLLVEQLENDRLDIRGGLVKEGQRSGGREDMSSRCRVSREGRLDLRERVFGWEERGERRGHDARNGNLNVRQGGRPEVEIDDRSLERREGGRDYVRLVEGASSLEIPLCKKDSLGSVGKENEANNR